MDHLSPQGPCVPVVEHVSPPPPLPSDDIMAAFPSVLDGQVKLMEGAESHIELVHNPYTTFNTVRLSQKLQDEPALLQAQCAPIIVVSKKVSDCIRPLTSQQVHQEGALPVTLKRWWTMLQRKVFTAIKGYHQCPLDEVSQMLTTFITPFRRFKLL